MRKVTVLCLIFALGITSLLFAGNQTTKADSQTAIPFFPEITISSPTNGTYTSSVMTLNVSTSTLGGANIELFMNYSIDGTFNGSIPLDVTYPENSIMVALHTGLVNLPTLPKGPHRVTVFSELDMNQVTLNGIYYSKNVQLSNNTVYFTIAVVEAFSSQAITINPNGDITPSNAPLHREGNIYTLTAELNNSPITIEKGNIIIDGANYTLQGPGIDQNKIAITLMASNVTVANLRVNGWRAGVYGAFNNVTIANNIFISNSQAIAVYADDYLIEENYISGSSDKAILIDGGAIRPQGDNNLIIRNQIVNNNCAFDILNSNGTTIAENSVSGNSVILILGTQSANTRVAGFHLIYLNNFMKNSRVLQIPFGGPFVSGAITVSPAGQWDNGVVGNYWSDYQARYPNATEIGHLGIGDTSYLIEHSTTWECDYANGTHEEGIAVFGKAIDRYPLMAPNDISNSTILLPFASPSPSMSLSPSPSPSPSPSSSPSISPKPTPTASQQPKSSSDPSATKKPSAEPDLTTATVIIVASVAAVATILSVSKKRKQRHNELELFL
jgi:hypothetical protein